MELTKRLEKKEYITIKKGDNIRTGRQYNIGKSEFEEYAQDILFERLYQQFIKDYKYDIKRTTFPNGEEIIYLDLDTETEVDFLFYVKGFFEEFFLTRTIDEYIK